MRSSDTAFSDREMYERYLRTHKRYALLLTKKFPQEYAELLGKYYELVRIGD